MLDFIANYLSTSVAHNLDCITFRNLMYLSTENGSDLYERSSEFALVAKSTIEKGLVRDKLCFFPRSIPISPQFESIYIPTGTQVNRLNNTNIIKVDRLLHPINSCTAYAL